MSKLIAIAALALALAGPGARAQTYPARPITIVVPFPAGGPTDALVRILSERMRVSLGQPLVVEYVSGAAGTLGVGRVARAAPDGYTMLIGHLGSNVVVPALYSLPFDVLKDFAPVAQLPSNPFLLVTRNTMPATDLKGLVAWIKQNQDKMSAGTPGANSLPHVAGIQFQNLTGTRFPFVPYRGAGPAMLDLIAGQIDLVFDQVQSSLPVHPGRTHQSFRGHRRRAGAGAARGPDRGRSRPAGPAHLALVRPVGAGRHAARDRRQAQCRRQGCASRSGHPRAAGRAASCKSRRPTSRPRRRCTSCRRRRSGNGGRW